MANSSSGKNTLESSGFKFESSVKAACTLKSQRLGSHLVVVLFCGHITCKTDPPKHDAFQKRLSKTIKAEIAQKPESCAVAAASVALPYIPFAFHPASKQPRSESRIPFLRRSLDASLSSQISVGECSQPCCSGFGRVHHREICR